MNEEKNAVKVEKSKILGIQRVDDIDTSLANVNKDLKELYELETFESHVFNNQLVHQLKSLKFFHNVIVPQSNYVLDKAIFHLKDYPSIKSHQVVYVEIPMGYPKELYGVHYCYILKDCTSLLTVIPITSIKDDSEPHPIYEMDIDVVGLKKCRLHLDQILSIDLMRIAKKKLPYDVLTNEETIKRRLRAFFEI
jgi:hypothetical protein